MTSPLVVRCQANTYNGFRSHDIVNEKNDIYTPFLHTLAKEVKSQPLVVQKKFFKLLQKVQFAMVPLMTASKVHAEENINFPLLDKAYGLDILPDEVVTIMIQLIIGCGILGVVFAILCLMIAGGYRMIGQTDKAQMWSVDIIKGLGQVLLSPVIILLLVTLTGLVFKNIPGLDIFF